MTDEEDSNLSREEKSKQITPTLYNVLLRIAMNLLETRENVKISTHPLPYKFGLIFKGMKPKKKLM